MSVHPASEPRTRGRPASSALHAHVLAVATAKFLEDGYAASSIENIARAAGVSKVTIYRHFTDKAQLFKSIVRGMAETFSRNLEFITDERDDPETVLRDAVACMYEAQIQGDMIGFLRIVISEVKRFPDLAYEAYRTPIASLDPVIRYLERLDAAGILAVPDPALAAHHLATLASGGVRFLMEPPLATEGERDRHFGTVVSLFLDGYRSDRQGAIGV